MLQRLRSQCVFDLAPPITATLKRDDVLPDGETLTEQPFAQFFRGGGAIFSGTGNEDAGRKVGQPHRPTNGLLTNVLPVFRGGGIEVHAHIQIFE
jgi:hypothetical protein